MPRLIYNCEAWSNLKAADYKILQSAQLKYMRKVLEVPRLTPTAALYLELGIWPIRYEIEIRQLFFLKCVLNRKADDPCLQVYLEMLKFKNETNWGNEEDENIKNTSERGWKSIVKSSVYREAFLQLHVELLMNRKVSHLSSNKLCTKDYLKQLPPSLAKVVKTRMLDIKTNYKNKYYENLKCPFCCVLDEPFDHIFTCRFGVRVPKEIRHFRLQSFWSEVSQPVLEKYGQFLKRYLKYRASNLSVWLLTTVSGILFVLLLVIYSHVLLCIRFFISFINL